jgi:hypothetical protein
MLRDEDRMRVFDNMVLTEILDLKGSYRRVESSV